MHFFVEQLHVVLKDDSDGKSDQGFNDVAVFHRPFEVGDCKKMLERHLLGPLKN